MSTEDTILDASDHATADEIVAILEQPPKEPVRDEAGRFAKEAPADAPETESEPEAKAEGDDTAAAPPESEGEPSGESDGETEAETPIDPPLFWTAEAKARFAELPPDLQRFVADQESNRGREVDTRMLQTAAERKAAEAERDAAKQERQQYAETLRFVSQYAEAMDPIVAEGNRTDWVQLAQDDPSGYVPKWAAYQQRVQVLNAIRAEAARVGEQQMKESVAEQHRRLAESIPDFAQPDKAKAKRDGYLPTLTEAGFTPAEIDAFWANLSDHRMVRVMEKASAYDRLIAARKTVAQKKATPVPTKVTKPKASQPAESRESARIAALRKQAEKNPDSIKDVGAFILATLEERPQ